MKDIKKDFKNNLKLISKLVVIIIAILAYLDKGHHISIIIDWTVAIIVSLFITASSQSLVQRITKGSLEKIFLKIKIRGKEYSVSFFIIVSVLIKLILFY